MSAILIDALSALWRRWRGPEPALAERAAEIRGRMLRLRDPMLAAMFDEFIAACIQARALRRPSAIRRVARNFHRAAKGASGSATNRSKTSQKPPQTVKNSVAADTRGDAARSCDQLEPAWFCREDRAGGTLH